MEKLTQPQRQRSRDDETELDALQRLLQNERGAKRAIKVAHLRAALTLARDPAFACDPTLKKDDVWWAEFPVPAGASDASSPPPP